MKLSASKNFGFTLVELLVVIAIIGILSSVAVVNLGSARDKAKIAAMQETLASLRPVVLLCFSNEQALLCDVDGDPCTGGNKPEPNGNYGGFICTGSDAIWPDIADQYEGWDYCFANSSVANGTYSFGVSSAGGGDCLTGTSIICTESTCSVSS